MVVSAEALATVKVRVITKLYMYIDRKERQRPAFNYLELNQIIYLDMVIMVHLIYWFVRMFFQKHFDCLQWHYGIREHSFLLNNCVLSNHYLITQKLVSQFLLYKFYMKTAPWLKCFLVSRQKRNTSMFIAFVGSTLHAGICVACLKLTTLGRRIVNRLYPGVFSLGECRV